MLKAVVVDDDRDVRELVREHLYGADIECALAPDAPSGLALVRAVAPDLLILDLALPGADGLDVCRQVREDPVTARLPIIMLTASGSEPDRVRGFDVGADDYVVKPFSGRELVARAKAVLRRSARPPLRVRRAGELEIDEARRVATLAGTPLDLSPTEFTILRAIVRANGAVLPRGALVAKLWGHPNALRAQTRTVDVHVCHLRDKLGREGRRIVTVKGVGYRIDLEG